MITKEQAVEKFNQHAEKVRQNRIAQTERVKQRTIEWCNEELSKIIEAGASRGDRRTFINVAHYGNEADECITHIEQYGSSGVYERKQSIHIPTLIEYVQKHGFTTRMKEKRFNIGKSSLKRDETWTDGIEYAIEWA